VTGSIEDPRAVALEQLSLTVRCYNPREREGIETAGQPAVPPERHLRDLRGFTPEVTGELKNKLRQPWAAQPAGNQRGSGTAGRLPGPGRPGGLWLGARVHHQARHCRGDTWSSSAGVPGAGSRETVRTGRRRGMAPAGTITPDR
jgi:hypothetical protein